MLLLVVPLPAHLLAVHEDRLHFLGYPARKTIKIGQEAPCSKLENIARAFLPFRGLYTVHSQIFFEIISLRQFQLKCSPGFPEPPNQLGAEPLEQSQAKSPGRKKAMLKQKEISGHPIHAGILKFD